MPEGSVMERSSAPVATDHILQVWSRELLTTMAVASPKPACRHVTGSVWSDLHEQKKE